MVVLLGFAAISIDVARLYSERAQLQNGSDSVALMLAQICAKKVNPWIARLTSVSTVGLANKLARMNALDSQTNVKSLVLDKENRTATVTTECQRSGRQTQFRDKLFCSRIRVSGL